MTILSEGDSAALELTKVNTMIRKWINRILGRYDKISFKEVYDLTELAVVTFQQGDTKINLILDTGSSDNVIDKRALEKLEYEEVEGKAEVIGLTGDISEAKVCSLKTKYKDKDYEYFYVVADLEKPFTRLKKTHGVTLHGIIGTKFFEKYKYILDFEKLVAYSKM